VTEEQGTGTGAARPNEGGLPDVVYAQASPHSLGGVSMFNAQEGIHAGSIVAFASDPDVIARSVDRLREAGFDVLQVTDLTINIAGSPDTYARAFNTTLQTLELPVRKELGREDTATFIDSPGTDLRGLISTAGTPFAELLEGVALEEKRYLMAPSAFAPIEPYWHLTLPGDVSLGDNADRAHRSGITGSGVRVAMADTGHYDHPYFAGRGYRVAPVVLGPAAVNPTEDEVGHGTGECANMFAVAPDAQLLPVKINFVNTVGGFNAAVGLNPDIITCSWGSSVPTGPLSAADQALAAAVAAAVATGITVVFSAGNGHIGFPGQHPDVIAAGGTFMHPDGSLEASNYASGFISNVYPGRRVPDLCGLVGMLPRAMYLMLPLEPGDTIDVGNAGGAWPNGDQTADNDGWAAFSGTSAAAPQLAGGAALVKQACPKLTPAEIRAVLMQAAQDVVTGSCNPASGGFPATVGPDTATGNGLLDAYKAVLLGKLRCTPIVVPIRPISPIRPIQPVQPIAPVRPIVPIRPISPEPPAPAPPPGPAAPSAEEAPAPGETGVPLTAEDVVAIEEMVVRGELDLGG
jgi:hypothetical protein